MIHSKSRDRTAQQPQSGIGMDTRKSWMCGCKSHAGKYKGAVPWKCLECVKNKASTS